MKPFFKLSPIGGDYFLMWSSWVQGNSNGPLIPMVRLVSMEKHPIPLVLLVNMHLIKARDLNYFLMWSSWVQGDSNGPLVPMVRLVPMEKHPTPLVLLVNMHLIKGT